MRKPFKAGRWTLALDSLGDVWWLCTVQGDAFERFLSGADLRHIARLCERALRYRARGKAAK